MPGFLDRFRNRDVDPADRQLIQHMLRAGEKLQSRERETTHYLHFRTEPEAGRGAEVARSAGYDVEVVSPGDGILSQQVRAKHTIIVNESTIAAARRELTPVAESAGGYYDGWDTYADAALDEMSQG